jgi:hypothetical protein
MTRAPLCRLPLRGAERARGRRRRCSSTCSSSSAPLMAVRAAPSRSTHSYVADSTSGSFLAAVTTSRSSTTVRRRYRSPGCTRCCSSGRVCSGCCYLCCSGLPWSSVMACSLLLSQVEPFFCSLMCDSCALCSVISSFRDQIAHGQ